MESLRLSAVWVFVFSVTCGISAASEVSFEADVAPILIKRCLECHQTSNVSGGLVLSHKQGMFEGGESGKVIDLDDSSESLILQHIEAGYMPPEQKGISQKLPDSEIQTLQQWVAAGAKWPQDRILDLYERTNEVRGGRDWWSLQPLERPQLPEIVTSGKVHPVDYFVQQALLQKDLKQAPVASDRHLIRRLNYDTLGLPPAFKEIVDYERDSSPDKWAKLVNDRLASLHFGEKWARHWLDLVRFAETSGYERDQTKPNAWKYRDWVVNAFNSDMPYNDFIVHQLAGDEISERDTQSLIATGFLRLGTWNDEPNDPEDYQYDRLEDLVHATSSAFLGMTVKCARCHDHKFDPIPQLDYYRMASTFWSGAIAARDRKYLGGPTSEELGMDEILGWTDITSSPSPLHLLKNGNRHQPLQEVMPASLTLVTSHQQEFTLPPENAKTTQRRLQLSKWIASTTNPLTSRVIVNRIWQGYFGAGLVRTPNNFGFTGDQPSHPELLDWLASELIDHNWSLKHIHRLILTSSTYRQSANNPLHQKYAQIDFANRFLWRANRKRLDAEGLRDAVLSSTGKIDLRLGGPSFKPSIQAAALEGLSRKGEAWTASPPEQQLRRSLYIFIQRSLAVPMMTTFNFADSTLPCGQRNATTVAPQALVLLNNAFIHQNAEQLAAKAIGDSPDGNQQIAIVYQSILGREPSGEETTASLAHVFRQAERFGTSREDQSSTPTSNDSAVTSLASLCVVLFNSNEFLYVD
ncbi:PSD1 and planctomycete cytochrome C domain-containing protein [bacterium]|nr:PSD1 and planctomycete cytochrome C domain-containing protein [bacterium]